MSNSVLHFKSAADKIFEAFKPIFLKEKNDPDALLKVGLEFAAFLTDAKTNSLNKFDATANDRAEIDSYLKKLIDNLWLSAR